jgi:hypothetical protein
LKPAGCEYPFEDFTNYVHWNYNSSTNFNNLNTHLRAPSDPMVALQLITKGKINFDEVVEVNLQ